jgi:hypothetical protein
MPANEPGKLPDRLAALRHPTQGDVHLSRYWRAPERIPDVLKDFGPRSPPELRWIVLALDDMANRYSAARQYEPEMKYDEASALLDRLDRSMANTLSLWGKAAPLHPAILRALLAAMTVEERRAIDWDIGWDIDPLNLERVLLGVSLLRRDRDTYRAAFFQSPSIKMIERSLLWERLFDLLGEFGLHNPLIQTAEALHLALGIDPPNPDNFKQAKSEWIHRAS